MEVGAAFACGVLVTVAVLATMGHPPETQLYAPGAAPVTAAATSVTVPRLTPSVAYRPLPLEAVTEAEELSLEAEEDPIALSPVAALAPMAWGWGVLAVVLAAAVGAVLGHTWRRLSRPAGLAELEAVAVPAEGEWGMAAILGKRRALSRDRKDMLEAPWSEKRKHMAVALSRELREKYNVRSMVVRKGDEVRVHSGHQKGKVGKVIQSDIGNLEVVVEGVEVKKNNGKTVSVPQMPSRLEITNLVLDDPGRVAILERRAKGRAEEAERRRQRQAGEALPGVAAAVVASP
eukprot:EG_transcript_16672